MDIIGKKVKHSKFGIGSVVSVNDKYVSVQFDSVQEKKTFVYPDAFIKFVSFEDAQLQNEAGAQYAFAQKIAEDAKKKAEEERISKLASRDNLVAIKNRSGKKIPPRKNLAFKLNFCDGSSDESSIGFKGACSKNVREYNVNVAKHSWCSNDSCPCKKYVDGVISEREFLGLCEKDMVCYESITLKNWIAHAGYDLNGVNAGRPRRLPNAQLGSLAVLTTRYPNESEEERIIVGVFIIDDATEGDDDIEGKVTCKSNNHVEIRPNEVRKLKFWNYYVNEGNPEAKRWGTGLYRFIKDEDALRLLNDIVSIKENTNEYNEAVEVLEYYKKLHNID